MLHLNLEEDFRSHPEVVAAEAPEQRRILAVRAAVSFVVAKQYCSIQDIPAAFRFFFPAAKPPFAREALAALPTAQLVAVVTSAAADGGDKGTRVPTLDGPQRAKLWKNATAKTHEEKAALWALLVTYLAPINALVDPDAAGWDLPPQDVGADNFAAARSALLAPPPSSAGGLGADKLPDEPPAGSEAAALAAQAIALQLPLGEGVSLDAEAPTGDTIPGMEWVASLASFAESTAQRVQLLVEKEELQAARDAAAALYTELRPSDARNKDSIHEYNNIMHVLRDLHVLRTQQPDITEGLNGILSKLTSRAKAVWAYAAEGREGFVAAQAASGDSEIPPWAKADPGFAAVMEVRRERVLSEAAADATGKKTPKQNNKKRKWGQRGSASPSSTISSPSASARSRTPEKSTPAQKKCEICGKSHHGPCVWDTSAKIHDTPKGAAIRARSSQVQSGVQRPASNSTKGGKGKGGGKGRGSGTSSGSQS